MSEGRLFLRKVGAEVFIGIALMLTASGALVGYLNRRAAERAQSFRRLEHKPVQIDKTLVHIPFLYEGIDERPLGFTSLGKLSEITSSEGVSEETARTAFELASRKFGISRVDIPIFVEFVLFVDESNDAELFARLRSWRSHALLAGSISAGG